MSEILPFGFSAVRAISPALRSTRPWRIPGPASPDLKAAAARLQEFVSRPLTVIINDENLARAVREQSAWAGKPVETFITEALLEKLRSLDPNGP